jgi:monovalent cation/hydrogen antiporter
VISLIVQGFTREPLARFAGFGKTTAAGPLHEQTLVRLRIAKAGLARLDELAESVLPRDAVIGRLRTGLQARIGNTRARINRSPDTEPDAMPKRELRGDLIAAENAELSRLFEAA